MTTAQPRTDRREAMLDAALEVFSRDGYDGGNIDEVARVAGVAKPTVYSHFGDKATLFEETLRRGARRANERVDAVIDAIDLDGDDLRGELTRLGDALVGCVTHDDGAAVIRLQLGERARFPAVVDEVSRGSRERTIDRLAGKLAQLATAGRLRVRDPRRAARQLLALVADDALVTSGYGSRVLDPAELRGTIDDGVDTFLAAFGPSED
ncbi:TetR/AcrR family transcriptional regulator [Cellulosimicrobium cellulans]|uniref:TetR/AcrR family transcriptional regulator n=1 Tax=Cellulosimicrobium TaxID=157920 RepID=UPI0007B242C2|nr:TetR/AcrR family transcriptional regulator [Cellulosimicrobium sp. I38E]KZM78454.1 hypothetical protein A0J59_13360 [Cellulosimicrobium sp. I38E]